MRKKKSDPSARAQKNTTKLSLLVTIALSGIGTWRDFDSLYLCLVLNALALVLNVLAENLDALKCGGRGVFIAPTTKVAVGELCCRRTHRTLSGALAMSPNRWGSTVRALTSGATG
jgi:ABC-type branched-subunit amino acid transport system permease subunit